MQDHWVNERTIGSLLDVKAKKNGDLPFVFFEDKVVCYRELNNTANAVASFFFGLGVKKGDTVCIMLPNCLEYIYTWMGLSKLGAIKVPINVAHNGELLANFINQCGASIIVAEDAAAAKINKIRDKVPNLSTVIACNLGNREPGEHYRGFKVYAFSDLYCGDPSFTVSYPVHAYDPFCILYTSGTTGVSKGVVLPNNYAIFNAETIAYIAELSENDTVYCCLPLFHGHASLLSFMPSMIVDAKFVLGRRFSASTFWDTIRHYKVTVFNALGGIIPILYKQKSNQNDSENDVRVCIGMAPENIWDQFEKRFGLTIIEGYGSTESGLLTYNTFSNRKKASMGKTNPAYDVRIVDENDYEVSAGITGEVVSRPKHPWTMMTGYYDMPAETSKAFTNLWFHTGDYAFIDEDGFYFFVDRKKDCIRRKGENISSFEVEQIVNLHPSVLESAAIGVKSEIEDEEVKVFVVLKPGKTLLPEELVEFCNDNMANYMVPRYVEFSTELPKTSTEKVEKNKLKKDGINSKTWDRIKAGLNLRIDNS